MLKPLVRALLWPRSVGVLQYVCSPPVFAQALLQAAQGAGNLLLGPFAGQVVPTAQVVLFFRICAVNNFHSRALRRVC
jgi:hypothetical protein